jgi:two-component system, OmpR family, phosphate regulon sensor histidine kinase PhoR
MRSNTFRVIIVLAAIALGGIVATQIYWVNQALTLKRTQFERNVQAALASVTRRVVKNRSADSRLLNPVKVVAPFHYIVLTKDVLDPNMLSFELRREFGSRNINQDFELTLFDCATESLVFSDYITFWPQDKRFVYQHINWPKWDKENYYFGVYFPRTQGLVLEGFSIWIFSSIAVLFIAGFFAYTVWEIFRQRRLQEIQRDFIDAMTHEFKTPLATMSLAAEALKSQAVMQDSDRIERYSKIISSEVGRLRSHIDQILVNTSSPNSRPEKANLRCGALFEEVKLITELLRRERNATIELTEGLELSTYANKEDMIGVLVNLIENAVKYGGINVHIKLGAIENGKYTSLYVEDNGPGISEAEQKQLFRKFYRGTSHGSLSSGFGLGLFYVRNVIKSYGGKIDLKPAIPSGLNVILSIPGEGKSFPFRMFNA